MQRLGKGSAEARQLVAAVLGGEDPALRVALVEPMAQVPNNFAISGGLFPAAGSALQRAGGDLWGSRRWQHECRSSRP